jgi:competence protein CoiA
MLAALRGLDRIEAADAERGGSFVCPGCRSAVILKRGRVKIAHFAHMAPVSCSYAAGETAVHMAAKAAICAAFRARGLRAEVEFPVGQLSGDRRADVLVWGPAGQRVAVEVQHSAISLDDIARRTAGYMRAKIPVVWLPVLKAGILWDGLPMPGGVSVEKYPAPHWQRWVHGYGFGGMWVMLSDLTLWRGRMLPCEIEVPSSSWYDEDGDECSGGGYTKVSRKWKTLELRGAVDPADIRVELFSRPAASLGRHVYPGGRAARFVTADFLGRPGT